MQTECTLFFNDEEKEKERVERDEKVQATIRRIDTETDESHELTITDEEEFEEISAIMSVIVLANARRKLFKAAFIALCVVTAVMLAAYAAGYGLPLNAVVAAGVCNLVFLQRFCHWSSCGIAAMMRCEEFFERHIAGEEQKKLPGC